MQRTFVKEAPGRVGETIEVAGWVRARRDHGKLVFLDVRDSTGILQLVCTPKEQAYETAQRVRPEWVVKARGEVQERPEDMKNPDAAAGSVELKVQQLTVLSEAATPPFPLDTDGYEVDEEKRLSFRYLDLRRERLQLNLKTRSKMTRFIRNWLGDRGFAEIETPLLTKSTPEGARDFLVPSRLEPGKFYALPQSPQQYKQLLQVAGFERYFQIVRNFRDEDPRGDRQAEFTQLDIEMSFVEQEDVLEVLESLYTDLAAELFPQKRITATPFPRISYLESMEKYQTDKPDLRENPKDPDELAFCFIVDFPAFEWKEREKRWDAVHHPFTLPKTDSIKEIQKDPASVLAHQYDLALNGYEIAGGSLRITDPEFLRQIFEFMGNKKQDVEEKFGHLLAAFAYGVPPHGGIAGGFDRLAAVLLGEPNIREVMAFPKTGDNRDLMMKAPSEVSKEQLKELHIEVKNKK